MLREAKDRQVTMLDFWFEDLIPKDSWAREFRATVEQVAPPEFYNALYHPYLGRTATDPTILTGALLLQAFRGWTDRELEREVRYNIETKYALGLELNHKGFDHSTFSYHRNHRLIHKSKDKVIFDAVYNHMVKVGVVDPTEPLIVDSTNLVASIAIVSPIEFMRRAMVNVIRELRKCKVITDVEIKGIGLGRYIAHLDRKARATGLRESKMPEDKKLQKIAEVYSECKALLKLLEGRELKCGSIEVEILRRILRENITEGPEGVRSLQPGTAKDGIVSLTDPEVRNGAKNKKLKYDGYKGSIMATKSGVIAAIGIDPANSHDSKAVPALIDDVLSRDLHPKHLLGDSAYGTGEIAKYTKERQIRLAAKAAGADLDKGYRYDPERDTITCPHGVESTKGRIEKCGDKITYSFHKAKCLSCPILKECREGKRQKRIKITVHHALNSETREYNRSQEYKNFMKDRPFVERSISWLVNGCKVRRLYVRGKRKAEYKLRMASAILNLMHCLKRPPRAV